MFSKVLEWIRGKTVKIEVDLNALRQQQAEIDKKVKQKMIASDWLHLRESLFKAARNQVLEETRLVKMLNWLEEALQNLIQKELNSLSAQPVKVVKETVSVPTLSGTEVYFSPGDECLNAIIKAIRSASTTLDICVFTISDDRITREITAAHKRKVKVRVITDDEKMLDAGSDIQLMKAQGIAIHHDKGEGHMHHKFAIIDNKTLVNGSYNWTRGAAEYNYENLIVTKDKQLVTDFSSEFEELWVKLKV